MNSDPKIEQENIFTGSWERSNRNLTAAAFIGLAIIGFLYFSMQTFIATIGIIVSMAVNHSIVQGKTFLEKLNATMMNIKNPVRVALLISQYGFMLLPTMYLIKRWHTSNIISYIRLKRTTLVEIMFVIVITLLFIPTSAFISEFLLSQLNFPDFLAKINAQVFTSYSSVEFIGLIIVVCLTPAVCEEILFRGYVQRTLERSIGIKSFLIVGFVFGLFHMEPLSLISLSLLGMIFGYFYIRSGSIIVCMIAHFINNFIATLSLFKTPHGTPVIPALSDNVSFLLVALTLPLFFISVYFYHQITEPDQHDN